MNRWFNEAMTSNEARLKLCSISKDEYEKNKKEIHAEYFKVLKKITQREIDLAEEGWIF